MMKRLMCTPLAGIVVTALALTLAGCGGSSSTQPEPPVTPDPAIAETAAITAAASTLSTATAALGGTPTQAAVDTAKDAITALQTAIGAATHVSADVKAGYNGQLATAQGAVTQAEAAIKTAADAAAAETRMKMAAEGKALQPTLDLGHNGEMTKVTASGLTVDWPSTGGDTADSDPATLKAGDAVAALGGWNGMMYSRTDGTGTAKVTHSATVYTNRDAPKSLAWTSTDGAKFHNLVERGAGSGTYGSSATNGLLADPDSMIEGSMFPTVGEKTFKPSTPGDSVEVTGTYAGASGKYFCVGNCKASYTNTGIALSSGTWTFTPDTGAMVSMPDPEYLYFGWWLREDRDGPTHASAFQGIAQPTASADRTLALPDLTLAALQGDATYTGKAAGKFAYYNRVDKSGDAGHFTADAKLMAKFGGTSDPYGVTGTISNFMANGQAVPWSVKLNRASPTSEGSISSSSSEGTVWSINGNPASASGKWSGLMYDNTDDNSTVPVSATGVFESKYGLTHTMVGAFGVEKDD